MNAEIRDNPQRDGRTLISAPELWRVIPAFSYRPLPFAASLRDAAIPVLILFVWLAAFSGASVPLARRLKP